MNRIARAFGLVALLGLASWLSYQVKREVEVRVLEQLDVGDPAPDFTLADLEGKQVSLSDYRGRVVVLNFWTTYCAQRKLGMALIDSFCEQHRDSGVVVLSINLRESPERVRAALAQREAGSRVLLDPDGQASVAFGLKYIPTVLMLDGRGTIVWFVDGYLPDLAQKLSMQLRALGGPPAAEGETANAGDPD